MKKSNRQGQVTIFKTVGELNTCLTLFLDWLRGWELTQTNQ